MNNLKDRSINGVIWSLIEKIGIQIVRLVLGIILARMLTPADYGLIGIITVFFAIVMVFINSGFGMAFIQKQGANEIDASTIFYFNMVVSLFFYMLLWLLAPYIAIFYDETQLTSLIRVLSIILIINSFTLIQFAKLTKGLELKKKTIIILVSAVLSGFAGITAALLNFGVWSLVVQQIVSALAKSVGLWFLYKWRPLLLFRIDSLKSMLSFSTWSLSTGVIVTVFNNIYILVIGKFFPIAELGFYTKAKQFQQIVSNQMSTAVGEVAFPVLSKIQNDKIYLKKTMRNFFQYTMFFIAPFSAFFFVIAKPFFLILLTEKWLPMVPYFQLLLIAGVLYPIHMINVQVLSAQGKMRLNFFLDMIKNSLRIINLIIMYRYGVLYIIIGEIVLSYLSLIINTFYTKKFVNYGILEQFKDISAIILTSVFLTITGVLLINNVENDFLKIITAVLFIGSLYLISMYYFNRKILFSILNLIKNRLKNR